MSLDYGYTCPSIDEAIESSYEVITDQMKEMLERFCDSNELEFKDEFEETIKSYTEYIMIDLKEYFEGVRATNSDMRSAAEKQIDTLQDKIEELESEIQESAGEYEEKISQMNEEVCELNDRIEELENLLPKEIAQ